VVRDFRNIVKEAQEPSKWPWTVMLSWHSGEIFGGLVNTQTHRQIHTDSLWPAILLAQPRWRTTMLVCKSRWLAITRNSSEDEIANVNFLYDDIVHALENTIDITCINSATDRFMQRRFTKFTEITQCNGHHAVQGHSRSPIWVPIESSYMTSY